MSAAEGLAEGGVGVIVGADVGDALHLHHKEQTGLVTVLLTGDQLLDMLDTPLGR